MGDADKYESDETTSGTDAVKHYEINVPAFTGAGTDASGASATWTVGNSCLRLGSAPSLGSPPAELAASVALAKLVGDPAAILAAETVDKEKDGSFDTLAGDGNYLLGFADDTRYRQGKGANEQRNVHGDGTQSNTGTNRQKETLALLTKGGWWDHTDGNRVTTTTGDKVEVIQGNYKMVVLGRQPLPPAPATGNLTDTQRTAIANWQALQAALDRIVAASGETLAALLAAEAAADPLPGALPTPLTIATDAIAAAAAAARATFTTDAAYNAGLAQYNEEQAVAGFVGGTFITDVSGGNFQEQYASPTPCIKTVEYTEIDGIWTLYQDNGTGNVHTHYGWGDITDTYDVRNKSTNIGSSGQRTTINDKTYAQSITTLVDSNGINATTSVDGDIVGVTTSTTITNSVDAKATVVNQTAAGASIISVNSAPTALNVNIVPVLTGNINVGALTLELAAGLKFALSATRVSVRGKNVSLDGGKTTVTLTEEKLAAAQTALTENTMLLAGEILNLAGSEIDLSGENIKLGDVETNLTAVKFF